jgi:hypothetical protein
MSGFKKINQTQQPVHVPLPPVDPRPMEAGFYHCPCCQLPVLEDWCKWFICPVCWWEDDGLYDPSIDEVSEVNRMTLREARERWSENRTMIPVPENFPTESELTAIEAVVHRFESCRSELDPVKKKDLFESTVDMAYDLWKIRDLNRKKSDEAAPRR